MRTAGAIKRERGGGEEEGARGGRARSTRITRSEGGGGMRTAAVTIERRKGREEEEGARKGWGRKYTQVASR